MPEQVKLKRIFINTENGKAVRMKEIFYEGPRFIYYDYPQYTAAFENYGEWSILQGLCETILYHRTNCIVELGAGESTKILGEAADRFGVKFYSVDINPKKMKGYSVNYKFYHKKIEDFMKEFDDTPSIVLIDANHAYDVAKKEFEFFFEKLVEGGVIFLHDTYPPHEDMLSQDACSDVFRLRQELEKMDRNEVDVFTWPYGAKWCGLTMVIKKEKDRPYWGL